MGAIYANACDVRIWLGKSNEDWSTFKWLHDTVFENLIDIFKNTINILQRYDPTQQSFWDEFFLH